MNYPYFDNFTIVLYSIFGFLCVLSIHIAKGGEYSSIRTFKGFSLLFITLFCFSVFRKVGLHLGGEDALSYQEGFINYFNHGAERFETTDVLYGFLVRTIRSVTDNPYIFRGICYSLIICGYIVVINKLAPHKISPVPFICILIPFMRSFGSMRNSISISFFLIAICAYYDRKYLWCCVWIIASVLIHRLSFVMLAIFPFLWAYDKYLNNISYKKLIVVIACLIILSYILARILQQYIILFSLFESDGNADAWYLTNGKDKNVLLSWPMYITHLLLLIAISLCHKNLPKTRRIVFLLKIFWFDIIILPATLVLGMWRIAEYLFIPNLILWSILIPIFYKRFSASSRSIIQLIFLTGFWSLMCIRLMREWQDLAIMPYLFFWQ